MTLLCKCGHSVHEHNYGNGPCAHTEIKDFRKPLSDKRNLVFCQCKKYEKPTQ